MDIYADLTAFREYADFEGFRFYESDGTDVTVSPADCEFFTEDLSSFRLIGFRTIVSDY